ncbi:NAD(P)/FAD-dependent oxidoreductase [Chryseolinea lacunae]|uniref:NAD(P)/FAD-dependent oxidoreductase n=1 Tax=Chryseolinea lacunae TaxID=2801331 RepID=A0ABS1KQR4_9BACT|nr:NAD(P)/FAD-dependent oxidoreductase [Chryseolinea lacunae]MBL0741781.1 NAD(P)/FAD-dependent oxidoreductase [Chryseolinea lacunae]
MKFDLVVIGGGAAGFFGAIQAAEQKPGLKILILEKTTKLLTKVKVSGGGRCNVTHDCINPFELARHYPRGEKALKNLFKSFHAGNTVAWFEGKGVSLKVEDDGRMFPDTDSSQTIIDCFMREVQRHKIRIEMEAAVLSLRKEEEEFLITTDTETYHAAKVLIATGGSPNAGAYQWIADTGHAVLKPIPSLFTFNEAEKNFSDLMGIAVPNAEVKITGTKFSQQGPLLITHWGLSGPAVIKLSAWAAEYLHGIHYTFQVLVSWIGAVKEADFMAGLQEHKAQKGKQKIVTNPLFGLPQRLWERLCSLAEIDAQKIWADLPQKNMNKLMEFLIRCPFQIKGKTTFKEEFVTCGGVDVKTIDLDTMQSKTIKNLFFAGEVLNIDGETGGFNFQAAWTTAYVAAKTIATS